MTPIALIKEQFALTNRGKDVLEGDPQILCNLELLVMLLGLLMVMPAKMFLASTAVH